MPNEENWHPSLQEFIRKDCLIEVGCGRYAISSWYGDFPRRSLNLEVAEEKFRLLKWVGNEPAVFFDKSSLVLSLRLFQILLHLVEVNLITCKNPGFLVLGPLFNMSTF